MILPSHCLFAAPEAEPPDDAGRPPAPSAAAGPRAVPEKYAKSALPPALLAQWRQRLEAHVCLDEPYLDGNLTLGMLARQLGLSVHHLSQVLNTSVGHSFYDYINGLRVREVQRCLQDPAYTRESILDIALGSGFNSKASFNAAFRRHAGMTPSQFRARSRR